MNSAIMSDDQDRYSVRGTTSNNEQEFSNSATKFEYTGLMKNTQSENAFHNFRQDCKVSQSVEGVLPQSFNEYHNQNSMFPVKKEEMDFKYNQFADEIYKGHFLFEDSNYTQEYEQMPPDYQYYNNSYNFQDSGNHFMSPESMNEASVKTESNFTNYYQNEMLQPTYFPAVYNSSHDPVAHSSSYDPSAHTSQAAINGIVESRTRKHLTDIQKHFLETHYQQNKFPSKDDQQKFASEMGLPYMKVKQWFINRRVKDKSDSNEITPRKHLTEDQKYLLEMNYQENKFPSQALQEEIALKLGLPQNRVKFWFMNRRAKENRSDTTSTWGGQKFSSPNFQSTTSCNYLTSDNQSGDNQSIDNQSATADGSAKHTVVKNEQILPDYYNSALNENLDTSTKGYCVKETQDAGTSEHTGRKHLSEEQKKFLETNYQQNKFPTKAVQEDLAQVIGLPYIKVKHWFVNRRVKDKSGADENSPRKHLTEKQKQLLEMTYQENKFPTKEVQEKLAQELELPYVKVKHWLVNRRVKDKDKSGSEERKHLTEVQKQSLENTYQENKFPSQNTQEKLAQELGLPSNRVKYWFMNRRTKDKSESKRSYGLTEEKQEILEVYFAEDKFPTKEYKAILAKDLGVSFSLVDNWFSNRRNKGLEQKASLKKRYDLSEETFLEDVYKNNKNPTTKDCKKLAKTLGVTFGRVYNWFYKKRKSDDSGDLKKRGFDDESIAYLESEYQNNGFPNMKRCESLAESLNVSTPRVYNWFKKKYKKNMQGDENEQMESPSPMEESQEYSDEDLENEDNSAETVDE